MQIHRFNLTLQLPFEVCISGDVSPEEFAATIKPEAISRILTAEDYDEGRYAFSRELLMHALQLMLENAVHASLLECMIGRYGHQMIPYRDGEITGETNQAHYEAEKWWKQHSKGTFIRGEIEDWKATVTPHVPNTNQELAQ